MPHTHINFGAVDYSLWDATTTLENPMACSSIFEYLVSNLPHIWASDINLLPICHANSWLIRTIFADKICFGNMIYEQLNYMAKFWLYIWKLFSTINWSKMFGTVCCHLGPVNSDLFLSDWQNEDLILVYYHIVYSVLTYY